MARVLRHVSSDGRHVSSECEVIHVSGTKGSWMMRSVPMVLRVLQPEAEDRDYILEFMTSSMVLRPQ